jgi:hypothetical protein
MSGHLYHGRCPDINQPEVRDLSCPACNDLDRERVPPADLVRLTAEHGRGRAMVPPTPPIVVADADGQQYIVAAALAMGDGHREGCSRRHAHSMGAVSCVECGVLLAAPVSAEHARQLGYFTVRLTPTTRAEPGSGS